MYPAYIVPQQNFTFTVEIEEVYLPSFNVFKDGAVLAEGVFGDGFVDSDVLGDTEYCYTVEQVMPDGGLSGMSNEACAMPITAGTVIRVMILWLQSTQSMDRTTQPTRHCSIRTPYKLTANWR